MNKNMQAFITVGTIIATSLASYFTAQMSTQAAISNVSERTAKLETSLPRIEEDIRGIKQGMDILVRQSITKKP